MHVRRFACMLLGMWLGCSGLITWITLDSFQAAPHVIEAYPPLNGRLPAMAPESVQKVLAYGVRQQVGWWLEGWGNGEIAIGVFFFFYLLLGTREGKLTLGLSLIPLAAAAVQRGLITPQLIYLGGKADFAPELGPVRLGLILVEAIELCSGAILALLLIGRQHRREGLTLEAVEAIKKRR